MFRISAQQHQWYDFVIAMTEKEIKTRYKHTSLGFLWMLLNPLLQMIVIGFVFHFFIPVRVDNYFLFLFAGLLPWNFFSLSITKTTSSIVFERNLIEKAKFPRETIPLSIVLSHYFHLLVSMSLLLIILIGDKLFMEHYSLLALISYSARMLWLVPLLAWLLILTIGISLLTSALNVRYRDINFFVQALIPLWFYATPVIYTLNLLPKIFYPFFYLNPMTAIIEGFHWILLFKTPTVLSFWLLSLLLSVILITWGLIVFRKESPYFDDWV